MSPVLFIDFEAFQHGDEEFQIKELCILDADLPLKPLTFLFKPNRPWEKLNSAQKQTYAYQEHHLHHLSWGEGNKSYCANCVERHIKRAIPLYLSAQCYVLGRQKAEFLRREFPMLAIIDYDYVDSYKDISRAPSHLTCTYRNHSKEHCAVLKCYRLLLHYQSL
jgi:hypothetical protein